MDLQETYFLHGISFFDELRMLLTRGQLSAKARGDLYLTKIRKLVNRLQNVPAIEVALGWIGADVFTYLADHIDIRVVHAPFVDGTKQLKVQGKELFVDITVFNQGNLNRLLRMLKLIAKMKDINSFTTVIFHPVPYGKDYRTRDDLLQNMYNLLRHVCSFLQDNNIFLTIENMPWLVGASSYYTDILGDPQFFIQFFELCHCPNIGMTFDFGHANSMARFLWQQGKLSTEQLENFTFPLSFIDRLKEKIYHVHFHYNPAHKPRSKPLLTRAIPKFKNYDIHNKVQGFSHKEWLALKNKFDELINSANVLSKQGTSRTLTLEVAPRSLNSLDSYVKDMNIFKKHIMLKYKDNKNKLIKGEYGKHFKS